MDTRKLRDEMAEDYRRNYQRLGVNNVSHETFQKLAAHDLELVDKDERTPAAPSTPKKTTLVREKDVGAEPDLAAQMAGDINGKFYRKAIAPDPVRKIVKSKSIQAMIGEKGAALAKRYAQILETEHLPGQRFLCLADRPYKYPALAKDALTAHADYTMRRKGYQFLKDEDCRRLFLRTIEDICDRSNGTFRVNWWCK